MKTAKILRRTAARLLTLALTLALASTPALAAGGASVHIEDTAYGYACALSGDGYMERFEYDVPEDGVTALIFFKTTCGHCMQLFRSIAQGALADDPRLNVVAVCTGEDRAAAQSFVDTYMGGKISNVYYDGSSLLSSYGDLVDGGIGTAFVVLIAKEGGTPYVRWWRESVSDGRTIQEQVGPLLEGGRVQMTKAGESVRDGRVCLLADLSNGTGSPVSGTLYAVGYTGGRMTDVQALSLTLPAGGSSREDFTVKGDSAKLFYLEEGTLWPLSDALTAGA